MNHRTIALFTIPALLVTCALTAAAEQIDLPKTEPKAETAPATSAKPGEMTLEEAKFIIDDALMNPPCGRRPRNPGFDILGKETTSVLTYPNRRGNCLVEVRATTRRAALKFYTRTEDDAKKFAAALARIKAEYAK